VNINFDEILAQKESKMIRKLFWTAMIIAVVLCGHWLVLLGREVSTPTPTPFPSPTPTPTCEELEGMECFASAAIQLCGCPDQKKIPGWISIPGCE